MVFVVREAAQSRLLVFFRQFRQGLDVLGVDVSVDLHGQLDVRVPVPAFGRFLGRRWHGLIGEFAVGVLYFKKLLASRFFCSIF